MSRIAAILAATILTLSCSTQGVDGSSDGPPSTESSAGQPTEDGSTESGGPQEQAGEADSPSDWRISMRGFGPVMVGMSPREASAVTGGSLVALPEADTVSCAYLPWPDAPSGVSVMVVNGAVARVDVQDTIIATEAGARVGDSEDRIRALYGDRLTDGPHKYTDGRYLTVLPEREADSAYRIVFETENGRVTRYRSGVRPPVEYVEGCG